jgi:hypothetical protein
MIDQVGLGRYRERAALAVAVTIVTPRPRRRRTSDDKAPQRRRGACAQEQGPVQNQARP